MATSYKAFPFYISISAHRLLPMFNIAVYLAVVRGLHMSICQKERVYVILM